MAQRIVLFMSFLPKYQQQVSAFEIVDCILEILLILSRKKTKGYLSEVILGLF
jgi:hypothetical protein